MYFVTDLVHGTETAMTKEELKALKKKLEKHLVPLEYVYRVTDCYTGDLWRTSKACRVVDRIDETGMPTEGETVLTEDDGSVRHFDTELWAVLDPEEFGRYLLAVRSHVEVLYVKHGMMSCGDDCCLELFEQRILYSHKMKCIMISDDDIIEDYLQE